MDCRRVKKSMIKYADGGLSGGGREEVGRHLESCQDCAALVEKLSMSALALGSLGPVRMPEESSARVLSAIGSLQKAAKPAGGGFFRSPRVIATAGMITAVLVALAIVVGLYTGDRPGRQERVTEMTVPATEAGSPAATHGFNTQKDVKGEALASLVLPVASVTANNYNQDSIKNMAENLDVKKKFAERYTLSDAINMRVDFNRKLADEFVDAGGDGPVLEAMISYVQSTEPVLLPCYAEKALFSDRSVYIIALCGPPRSGASKELTRTEFWAFNPEKFATNPELSLVWWGQSQK